MRDEFSEAVKQRLARRVGYRCSNPDCGITTVGPAETNDRSVSIGEASHIFAASPGGPRYKPSMSPEERKSIHNGIWLCRNCGKLIDSDVDKYTSDVLLSWKKQAENNAAARLLGKCRIEQEEYSLFLEAEEYAADAIELLRYCISRDKTHLIREIDLRPSKDVIFGGGSNRFSYVYDNEPTMPAQFELLEDYGLVVRQNSSRQVPIYKIVNTGFYRWLQN